MVAIDIIGTVRELVKWVIEQILILIGVLLFGLSAPLLYTVGAEYLIWTNPGNVESWATTYWMLGPVACCIWMVFICYLADPKYWQALRRVKTGELPSWQSAYGGHTLGKPVWFMVGGFIGSVITEGIFLTASYYVFPHSPSQTDFAVAYAVAPLFVFAPVLLVLLRRRAHKNEYATA